MKRTLLLSVVFLGLAAIGATNARAQTSFGAEAMFSSDNDLGLGARLQLPLATTVPLEFSASFDLFFPDGPREYWELNGNVWYKIETRGASTTVPYVGGGLNIGHGSGGSGGPSDTQLGLNLGGGARFEFANTTPFLEARFTVGGVDQFVIGGGFLFGSF